MALPKRIVLVRHGESERNALKGDQIFYPATARGRTLARVPSELMPLSKRGYAQARLAGSMLKRDYGLFDAVFHSGMHRAEQTMRAILTAYTASERRNLTIGQDLRIRERDPGYAYGMTAQQADCAFPWLQQHFSVVGNFFARPPGGESVADVTLRVRPFLRSLQRSYAGQSILVVTHGGVITGFRYLLEDWNYLQARHGSGESSSVYCGVTVFERDKAGNELVMKDHNKTYTVDDEANR